MKKTPILAFLGGAAAGFITAMMVAPKSGHDTREKIKELIDDTEKKLHHMKICMMEHKHLHHNESIKE